MKKTLFLVAFFALLAGQACAAYNQKADMATATGTLPVVNGGTGATTASGARTTLGLGSMATQAADNVAITGGAVSGLSSLMVTTATITTMHGTADAVATINGKITAGSNVTVSGSGTSASPYSISSGSPQTVTTKTGSYTIIAGDAGKLLVMNCSSACNLTVAPNSSAAIGVGSVIDVVSYGAGAVTLVAGSGVTILSPLTLVLSGQYARVQLQKLTTDGWIVEGRLQ